MKIAIVEADGDSETRIELDSDDPGYNLHEMQVGENRSIVDKEGVMIVRGKEIDEATRQIIRTALESAGHENVHFSGGHEGGPHRVHVIRKVVEVTD